MADRLDFKDINNFIYLSSPENHKQVCHYAQVSMLWEVQAIPELEWHPATADKIMLCRAGSYDPLELMASYEKSMGSLRHDWSAVMPDGMDIEDFLSQAKRLVELSSFLDEPNDELASKLVLIGSLMHLSTDTLACATALREFYSDTIIGARMLSAETGLDVYSILENKCHTDELARLVFPNKETAISQLTANTFFFLPLWKSIRSIQEGSEFDDEGWRDFSDMASGLPEIDDIDEALEIHSQYVAEEMDRIYS